MRPIMISCQQRIKDRELSLSQIEPFVGPVTLYLNRCRPDSEGLMNTVATQMLREAIEADVDILCLEDDIDIAPDFGLVLDAVREKQEPTYLYWNENDADRIKRVYPSEIATAILKREPLQRALVRARTHLGIYGAQCVYVPRYIFPKLLEILTRKHKKKPLDNCLQKVWKETEWMPLLAVPNVVQHRNSLVARTLDRDIGDLVGDRRSLSYDLPRVGDTVRC